MDIARNPDGVDGAVGVAAMILDQLIDARAQPLPGLGPQGLTDDGISPICTTNSATPRSFRTGGGNAMKSCLLDPSQKSGRRGGSGSIAELYLYRYNDSSARWRESRRSHVERWRRVRRRVRQIGHSRAGAAWTRSPVRGPILRVPLPVR